MPLEGGEENASARVASSDGSYPTSSEYKVTDTYVHLSPSQMPPRDVDVAEFAVTLKAIMRIRMCLSSSLCLPVLAR